MALVSASRFRSALLHQLLQFSSASTFAAGGHAFDPEIRRLAKFQRFTDIEALLEPRKLNLPSDSSSREPYLASFIIAYASAGMLDHAVRTLDELPRLGSSRTILSLNALLSACNHSKTLSTRVPDLFSNLSRYHSLSPDKISYGILIKSLCLARDSSKALSVLKEMDNKRIEITAISYTTIMDSLYKEGKPEEADRLWKEMRAKGVAPDVAAYNVRAMYWAVNGGPDDVLRLIEEMKADGMEPDIFTYNYLMTCYCKHGRVDNAKRVYRELGQKGCEPNAATYKNLLYSLCKNNDFVGGLEVFEDCVKHRRVPDLGSVMALVKGLMKDSKIRAAKRVVTGLRKKFPEEFSGSWMKLENVVGLSNDEKVPISIVSNGSCCQHRLQTSYYGDTQAYTPFKSRSQRRLHPQPLIQGIFGLFLSVSSRF
ncbi:pentatricopeptide repeat-containing protein At4g36680, mitochondrial isoform X2 [Dendrobium catenatum]|uniref:pentatricopeptide repeat-containing protein At4g36680, mitochondrial isoform X2 n=1 Tax=Dendrobium catenatum TaxID=906689 RepID=UPI00109F9C3C|nr:pentatricopeptide repeat-containing protein At4g36680, mitochondrial isoform X2 [Dendrobium catenatum]